MSPIRSAKPGDLTVFARRCGWQGCQERIEVLLSESRQTGRVPVYHSVECRRRADNRKKVLRRALDQVDQKLQRSPWGPDSQTLKVQRTLIKWELAALPGGTVGAAGPKA